jgi:hypothetical protein
MQVRCAVVQVLVPYVGGGLRRGACGSVLLGEVR